MPGRGCLYMLMGGAVFYTSDDVIYLQRHQGLRAELLCLSPN